MPPLGRKQKRAEDKRSAEDIAIDSAKTSMYNLCTPMYKAEHIRLRNPITGFDKLYSVTDPAFFEAFYEIAQWGLRDKLMLEIETFTAVIDPDWQSVYSALQGYFKAKEMEHGELETSSS